MHAPRNVRPRAHEAHVSFMRNVVIKHGPAALLGRLLLAADTEARTRGVFLSFAALDELVQINEANSATWRPLLPLFDPRRGGFDSNSALCLLGRNDAGDVVLTQAVRFFDWRGTSLRDQANSLQLLYREPNTWRREGEAVQITAKSAHRLSGRVAFTGAHWCRPDFRARGLSSITPRIARALAIALWDVEFTCTFMARDVFKRGVARRAGYFNVEWAVNLRNTPVGTLTAALLWSDRNGAMTDLEEFLAESVAADVAVVHRHA